MPLGGSRARHLSPAAGRSGLAAGSRDPRAAAGAAPGAAGRTGRDRTGWDGTGRWPLRPGRDSGCGRPPREERQGLGAKGVSPGLPEGRELQAGSPRRSGSHRHVPLQELPAQSPGSTRLTSAPGAGSGSLPGAGSRPGPRRLSGPRAGTTLARPPLRALLPRLTKMKQHPCSPRPTAKRVPLGERLLSEPRAPVPS